MEPTSHVPRPTTIDSIHLGLAPGFLATLFTFLKGETRFFSLSLFVFLFAAWVVRHVLNHLHFPSSSDDFWYFRAAYNGHIEDVSKTDYVFEENHALVFLIPRTGVVRHTLLGAHGYQVRFLVDPGAPTSLNRHQVQEFYTWASAIPRDRLVTAQDFTEHRSATNKRDLGFVVEELW